MINYSYKFLSKNSTKIYHLHNLLNNFQIPYNLNSKIKMKRKKKMRIKKITKIQIVKKKMEIMMRMMKKIRIKMNTTLLSKFIYILIT